MEDGADQPAETVPGAEEEQIEDRCQQEEEE